MLRSDDQALADALAGGQTIETTVSLWFDWQRDGRYATPFADLSDAFQSATGDAQFTGQYPAELEVNDGYAQRRFTVTLTGQINGVDAVVFFSPFAGYYGGAIGAVNTPMYFEVVVQTANGPVSVRQFTGYLIEAHPKRSDGTVELECADVTSQLTNAVTLYPSARSQALAQWGQSSSNSANDRMRQRGGNSLSWYLLHVCRSSGLYQGPKPPSNAVAYWTLAGGVLPEIGNLAQMPRDGRQSWPINVGSWIMSAWYQRLAELPRYYHSFDYDTNYPIGPWSPDLITPEAYPLYMWQRGPYGPEMQFDVYNTDTSSTGTKADRMHCIGTTATPINVNPSSGNVSRVGIGGWLRCSGSVDASNHTQASVMLTGFASSTEVQPGDVNQTQVLGPVGNVQFTANPRSQLLQVDIQYSNGQTGWSGSWRATYTPTLADGVHYVAAVIEFPYANTDPVIRFKVDDTVTTRALATTAGQYPTGKSSYTVTDGRTVETSGVNMETTGGAQHWCVWHDANVTTATAVNWSNDPECLNYQPLTDISPSEARVMWTPNVVGKPAWDVLKEIGSNDLGVIYTTEDGVLHYRNWTEIRALQNSSLYTAALTLDDLDDVDPYTTFDSVINQVTYTTVDKWAVDDAIFKASDPQQFQVASGRVARWQTTVDDAMSVLPGPITPRRLAQGYWSTTAGSGDNPMVKRSNQDSNGNWYDYYTAAFLPSDFMKAYSPDTWKNGFEGHNRGDLIGANSDQQRPAEGQGVFAYAAPGWAAGDTDPRHVTIVFQSTNPIGRPTTMAAVDDNTAFLNIRGYRLDSTDNVNTTVNSTDTSSFASFGVRNLSRPQSDWASDYYTQHDLTQKLADDLAQPRPVFTSIDVRGDPRRQLQDVVRIDDPGGIGGPIYASVVGINRKYDTSGGIKETLTLRTFGNRAAAWILGDPNWSVLGQSTILNKPA